ncbi:MAG: flagellar basal body rod protein FlgB [Syntrophomonadaceae bacterium]|nr:flagellar basal body rod protein FlgB [Syntrophomonadaceae bacterium]
MLGKVFSSATWTLLNKSMDTACLRNTVIADNIANADTPGFKRSRVIFEENVKEALEKQTNDTRLKVTNFRHIQIGNKTSIENIKPELKVIEDLSFRNDGNNVDIDVEMAEMSKNKIYYDALGQCMSNEIRLLRTAITGRE